MKTRPKPTRYSLALKQLGLPDNLLLLIENGSLHSEIARAYAKLDEINAKYDALEATSPEVAAAAPWAKAREAWKAAGRPRLDWYEALAVLEGMPVGRDKPYANLIQWPRDSKNEGKAESIRKASRAYMRRRLGIDPAAFFIGEDGKRCKEYTPGWVPRGRHAPKD